VDVAGLKEHVKGRRVEGGMAGGKREALKTLGVDHRLAFSLSAW